LALLCGVYLWELLLVRQLQKIISIMYFIILNDCLMKGRRGTQKTRTSALPAREISGKRWEELQNGKTKSAWGFQCD
jgi:hypothetical protein